MTERLADLVQKIEEVLLAASILLIAVLSIGNVTARILFDRSFAATEELSQFAIILVTFVGLSYAAGRGRHIRMTALTDQLGTRWRKVLAVTGATATACLMGLLTWFSLRYLETVAELGTVSPVLRIPLWLVYLPAPLGFVLAGLQYVLAVVKNLIAPGVFLSWQQKDEYDELITDGI